MGRIEGINFSMIKGFKQLRYHFLSNMFPCEIVYKGMQFKCSESIYQGIKTDRLEEFKDLDGYSAKQKAKTFTERSDWRDIKINVMKLVGASSNFITGPFLVTGAMYGIVSSVITLIIFWPVTFWLGPITERFFVETSIFEYYISSFGEMFLIIVGSGILIGSISSFLAIKRYLRIR